MIRALLAVFLAAAAPAVAGSSMSSESQLLPRQSVDAGGERSSSANQALHGAAGEQPSGASSSANYRLLSGALEVFSFPRAVTDLAGTATLSSATLSWSAPGQDGHLGSLQSGSSYYIRIASYTVPDSFSFNFANLIVSTSGVIPGQAVSTTGATGLIPNTTWYAHLWTSDPRGGASFASSRSTFTTLALPPRYLGTDAKTFLQVHYTSVTVAWGALPFSPPAASSETSQGYVVEASSTNFDAIGPGGITSSSSTYDARVSTLTVNEPELVVNRLYYFRVASRSKDGRLNYLVLGSTRTNLQANPPGLASPVYLAVTSHSVTAQWEANGNAPDAIYRLEASPNATFTVFKSSTDTYNLFAATNTLASNTTYFFQVRASTGGSVSNFVSLGSTVTLTPMPAAAGTTFVSLNVSSITLAWLPNGNPATVSTYTVVLQASSGDVVLSTRPFGPSPHATLTGLTPNTTYSAFVDARNWLGASSGYVFLGSVATRPADPATASPFALETAYSSMTVSWSRNGNPVDVTTYTVAFSTGLVYPNALPGNVVLATAPAGGTLAATATGLVLNATYYVHVRAVGHAGLVSQFALAGSTATRGVAPVQPDPPYLPISASSFKVYWSSGTEDPGFNWGGTTYYVEAAAAASFSPVLAQVVQVGGTELDLTGLLANTTYHVRVAAFDVSRGTWTPFTVYPATATLASTPAAVAFSAVDKTSATVTWTSADPVGVTTFTVTLSPEASYPNANPLNASAQKLAAGANGQAVAGLLPNTSYYPYVSAANRFGVETAYAAGAVTATRSLEPGAPLVSTFSMTSLTAVWSDVDANGYALYASSANGQVFFSSTTNGDATQLSVSGLQPNTTYQLSAVSYNRNAQPSSVEVALVSTLSLPPSNIAFKAVHETSATLTWWAFPAAPSSATSGGYRVDAATADAAGYSDFGGELISSSTYNRALSTLTVDGLTPGATYAFRVAGLNWAGEPSFAVDGSTRLRVTPFTWVGGGGNTNWYNSRNWSPRGVPNVGSPVTISLANVSVTVSASSPSINFSSLTLGSPGGARVNLHLSTAIASGGSVLIYSGAGLTSDSTQTLRINGDWTMLGGSSMTHTANNAVPRTKGLSISVTGTFDLRAGATVDVTTRGYAGGASNGGSGSGPGGGTGSAANSAGGAGGGHGGTGGDAGANAGGGTYDSAVDPSDAGSGGGGGDFATGTNVGGAGGGYVRISASSMTISGLIRADGGAGGAGTGGQAARTAGGGGSGGAVALYAGEFWGAGFLEVDGGSGGTDTDNADDPGGGGGGGLAAIQVSGGGNLCALTVTVAGGATGGGTSQSGATGVYSSTPTLGLPALTATFVATDTIRWEWTAASGAQNYRLFSSTGGVGNSPVLAQNVLQYVERGLLPNTTQQRYIQATACGASTSSLVAAYSTLAGAPVFLAESFPQTGETFVRAAWAAGNAAGYVVEASDGAGFLTLASSSVTYSAEASTLTLSGLERNTTYFFRAASLNWQSAPSSYTSLGSLSTLALPPVLQADDLLAVHYDSATLRWHRFYAFDPAPLRAEGFVVEASTTDFGALFPGGEILSSATLNVAVSTLTIDGLDLASTYYFRVGSLNHASAANYAALDRLNFQITPSLLSLNLGTLDPGVTQSTVATTAWEIRNVGNVPVTLAAWASRAAGTWSFAAAPDNEVATLQALLNGAQPPHSAFSFALTGSTASAGAFAGDQSGSAVPPGQTRRVWFRLALPTSTVPGPQAVRVEFRPLYP